MFSIFLSAPIHLSFYLYICLEKYLKECSPNINDAYFLMVLCLMFEHFFLYMHLHLSDVYAIFKNK